MTTQNFKYIIIDNTYPILFTEAIAHSDFKDKNITSAGFCNINANAEKDEFEVACFGESISLGITAKPKEDAEAIKRILNYY